MAGLLTLYGKINPNAAETLAVTMKGLAGAQSAFGNNAFYKEALGMLKDFYEKSDFTLSKRFMKDVENVVDVLDIAMEKFDKLLEKVNALGEKEEAFFLKGLRSFNQYQYLIDQLKPLEDSTL